jgi:hypothetical protein
MSVKTNDHGFPCACGVCVPAFETTTPVVAVDMEPTKPKQIILPKAASPRIEAHPVIRRIRGQVVTNVEAFAEL